MTNLNSPTSTTITWENKQLYDSSKPFIESITKRMEYCNQIINLDRIQALLITYPSDLYRKNRHFFPTLQRSIDRHHIGNLPWTKHVILPPRTRNFSYLLL
eukprot:485366_1